MRAKKLPLLASFLFFCAASASAQSVDHSPEKESVAILELGGTAAWNVKPGGSAFGPAAAVEITPIEHWLELEAGVTPLFNRHSTEWSTDLLFKKPWTLSKKIEFMAGIGPEWIHTRESGVSTNSLGGEAALDFMFWRSASHRFGWYLEPAYDRNLSHGHEQSLGITAGLLIAFH